mgnify:FL=1
MRKVIVVVGPIASGKGFVADYLEQMGYQKYSLSDRVREETAGRGLEIERKNLQDVGDDLRRKRGKAVLAEMTAGLIKDDEEKIVIESIRNPGEVEYFREKLGAVIIGVTANTQIRFERALKRGDAKTRKEFDEAERRDRGIGQDQFGQAVDECLKLADVVIENNGTYEEFKEEVDEGLIKLGIEGNIISPEGNRERKK